MKALTPILAAAVLALAASDAHAQWGEDINPGKGPELIKSARAELLAMVKASTAERERLVADFRDLRAEETQEAWKRFRNPELIDVFLNLADHGSWHVSHRALTALEQFNDPRVLKKAWELTFHSHPRVREKALITCLKKWDKRLVPNLSLGDIEGAVAAALVDEVDPYVRSCLHAVRRRHRGKLKPIRVSREFVLKEKDGLLQTPFLSGMNNAKRVAPGWKKKAYNKSGGGSAAKLPAARQWVMPLMDWGKEEVPGASLQPFANPRANGVVHTGHDVGAAFDGAGYYAIADGIVKMVNAGSDMGTLIVVEHHVGDGELVTALYMHGGDTVFVKAGEKVKARQILGSMGLSYSLENGGHYAHLHFGMYPGPFVATHNYGYKKKAAGLSDWHDPQEVLTRWVDWSAPIEDAAEVLERADRILAGGYPSRARTLVETASSKLRDGSLKDRLKEWKKDEAFKAALGAEKRLEKIASTEPRLLGKKGGAARIRQQYRDLIEEFQGNPVVARIRKRLEALE
ncbi:MAG: peptidoglycan DD-metalloendopeptidase family protein [Planctomycetota bacterium]|jgi:murein DD-endopeptidase MepM/ murein hydrolase activator NlpD